MERLNDCPNLIDASNGINKYGICKITNDICGYIRYCTTKKRIVSSELYHMHGCLREQTQEKENI